MSHGGGATWKDWRKANGFPADLQLNTWVEYAGAWCISRGLFLWIIYLGLVGVAMVVIPHFPSFALGWVIGLAPIWMPIGLGYAALSRWVWYVHSDFLSKLKPVLLEIKLPHHIEKSPRAMEEVFNHFYITSGEVTLFARAWRGSSRPFFSFELCSFGGHIHFYVWCSSKYRRVVETAFYSQYPEIEIVEAEDYAMKFVYDPDKHFAFAGTYLKTKGNLNPIKSYIDLELGEEFEKKEHEQVDPLASVFEVLSSLKPDEQAWIQFIIRANKQTGTFITHDDPWPGQMHAQIEKIRRKASLKPGEKDDDKSVLEGFPRPTKAQNEQIWRRERALEKLAFDVGAREIYIGPKKGYDGAVFTAVRWIWKPFMDLDPDWGQIFRSRIWHNDFDYPWQDWKDIRWNLFTRRFLDAYRRRSYHHEPWIEKQQVFSSEELATIWRFPSPATKAPGIEHMHAKKSEPPHGLPM
jgi:hypothetical protein